MGEEQLSGLTINEMKISDVVINPHYKPFDVSTEQLAHDLALLNVRHKLEAKENFSYGDYYELYIDEYEMFLNMIKQYLDGSITPSK